MADNFTALGPKTGYIPAFTSELQIIYSRNPDSFPINKFIGKRFVERVRDFYQKFENAEQARISSLNEFNWEFGSDRPDFNNQGDRHEFVAYECKRHNKTYTFDLSAVEQASWDALGQKSAELAMSLMVAREYNVATVLQTSGNWGSHTDTATSLGGGTWDATSSSHPYILNTLLAVQQQILKDTYGMVKPSDCVLVVSPALAATIRTSTEVIDLIKQSPVAWDMLMNKDNPNLAYGLPPVLYGYELVVDNVSYNSAKRNGTISVSNVYDDKKAVVLTKVDAVAPPNSKPFSTAQLFFYKDELTTEQEMDTWDRVQRISVTDCYDVQVVAPLSGFLITGCHS